VRIASQIAREFGLVHKTNHIETADVVGEWDKLAWNYVRQNDGMSSLFQIADSLKMVSEITRLKLSLHGIGGEIGRGFYGNPRLFLGRHDVAAVQVHMVERLVKNHGGLLKAEVIARLREYLNGFAAGCVDAGFRPLDVPDVFYAYQRVGRWGGNNARRTMPVVDLFSPFCTRTFVQAAFSLSAWQRYTEPLHYRLLAFLSPELHRLPFEKEGWRSQRPVTNVLLQYGIREVRRIRHRLSTQLRRPGSKSKTGSQASTLGFDRSSWLEAKGEQLREVCLDQNCQSLWEFIDRPRFERLMSSSTEPAERQVYRDVLYQVITLFYYEADHRSWLSTSPR
jgi:asparagine synthase (glutamine-hydrolysing)